MGTLGSLGTTGGERSARVFERWLEPEAVPRVTGQLSCAMVRKSGSLSEAELVEGLGREVVRNYVRPDELAAIFDDLSIPAVADHLRRNKFPSTVMIRHGDFGEIVAGAHYRLVARWCVPILKLRYKQRPEQAIQGADVLAFRFLEDPPVIGVVEVKTRATRKRQLGEEAHESLEKVLGRLNESLTFVLARCSERQQQFLVSQLGSLLRDPDHPVVARHMVFVHDTDAWEDDVVDLLVEKVTDPTELMVVKIDGLQGFVSRVFGAAESAFSQPMSEPNETA